MQPIEITNPQATAKVYRHGAHVAEFQPRGQRPVLFMSAKSIFEPGKPIRGGVPVIFPWFGAHPTDATQPAHGLVRLTDWELESQTESQLEFGLTSTGCRLIYRVTVGVTLTLELEVRNTGSTPVRFEEALHTYFVCG